MIDLHCHILPEVDDGAKNMEEAIKMARLAYEDGIRTIINTSHFYETNDFIKGDMLNEKLTNLQEKLKEESIEIEILLGNEAYISPNLPELIERQEVFTINHSRYVLLELPMQDIPIYTEEILYRLKLKGYIPIIAHPERYTKVWEEPNLVYRWIELGALIQVNSGSIRGRFGEEVQKTAALLLKHNLVHFIGSDGHSPKMRRPTLGKAFDITSDIVGKEYAKKIFYEHPKAVLENKDFDMMPPQKIAKGTRQNFFGRIMSKFRTNVNKKKTIGEL